MAKDSGELGLPLLDNQEDDRAGEHEPLVASSSSNIKSRWSLKLVFVAFTAVFGGTFQFGYNTGVVNQPKNAIRASFVGCSLKDFEDGAKGCSDNSIEWSCVVSLFAIGGLVGALLAGKFASRFGRRAALFWNNTFFVIAAVVSALAPNIIVLIVGRFIVGIGCGASTVVVPMYLSELSPVAVRGAVGTVNQLAITSGILISQGLGFGSVLGNTHLWRYLFALIGAPALYQMIVIWFCPRSPRWLYLAKNDSISARSALGRLRSYPSDVDNELEDLEEEKIRDRDIKLVTFKELLTAKHLRLPLILGIGLQGAQQLSGINAIFYFSTEIFQKANVSNAELATILVGVLNVVMTGVVVILMDRLGRRTLLLSGLGGMAVFYGILTIAWNHEDVSGMSTVTIASVMMVVFFFAIGPGAIPWLMIAEIFPATALAPAMSVCVGANWTFNFIVGLTFTPIQNALEKYTFIPFIVLCLLFFIFIYLKAPETKGKTIQQIQDKMNGKGNSIQEASM